MRLTVWKTQTVKSCLEAAAQAICQCALTGGKTSQNATVTLRARSLRKCSEAFGFAVSFPFRPARLGRAAASTAATAAGRGSGAALPENISGGFARAPDSRRKVKCFGRPLDVCSVITEKRERGKGEGWTSLPPPSDSTLLPQYYPNLSLEKFPLWRHTPPSPHPYSTLSFCLTTTATFCTQK